MIYILNGEDTVSSRKKISELVGGNKSYIQIDAKKQTLADIEVHLKTDSLFSEKKIVLIENFTKLKSQKDFFVMLNGFLKNANFEIILWEPVEISASIKQQFKDAKQFSFVFPKLYYNLLDNFVPNKDNIELLHEVLKSFEPEQILYGLTKRVRQLLVLKGESYNNFSEFKRMQDWQLSKLKKQAALWTDKDLSVVFIKLCNMDEELKTGAFSLPLEKHLDILLVSELN